MFSYYQHASNFCNTQEPDQLTCGSGQYGWMTGCVAADEQEEQEGACIFSSMDRRSFCVGYKQSYGRRD